MTPPINVTYQGGDRFELAVRQHRLWVDQPVADGGDDSAPTPTDLFVSSLAACVAFYARRFLARHQLPTEGLEVEADFAMAPRPARVASIALRLHIPADVPEDKRAALLAVARHCTVHNSLDTPPTVTLNLATPDSAAA